MQSLTKTQSQRQGWYDVTEYSSPQEAHDAAMAYGKASILYFPTGEYWWKEPLIADMDHITIKGDGQGASRVVASHAFPPVIVGVRRSVKGVSITNTNRPDAYGKLDTSIASQPGQQFGYKTKGEAHVSFWASAWNQWSKYRQLTINWCCEGGMATFGMGGDNSGPWRVITDTNQSMYCVDFVDNSHTFRRIAFNLPGDQKALHRVSLQVDFDTGKFQAYVDGVQVSSRINQPIPPGFTLLKDNFNVFNVGCLSLSVCGSHLSIPDVTFYGVYAAEGCLFKDQGVGQPQVRVDGRQMIDLVLFQSGMEESIVSLRTTKHGNLSLVPWRSGNSAVEANVGFGMFLPSGIQGGGNYNISNQRIRDISLTCRSERLGQGLAVGGNFGLTIQNVDSTGGVHGIGSAPLGTTWVTRLQNVYANGAIAGLNLCNHILKVDHLDLGWVGTTGIQTLGCNSVFNHLWMTGQSHGEVTIDCVGGDDGTFLSFNDIQCNQEGYPFPTIAAIRIQGSPDYRDPPDTVTMRNIGWGNVGPDACIVQLEEGRGHKPCYFSIEGSSMERSKILVKASPRWKGTIKTCDPMNLKTPLVALDPEKGTGIKVLE